MLKQIISAFTPDKKPAPDWELIGDRFFGEEDFSPAVSDWLRQQIANIEDKGLGDNPDELTHYITGRTFRYKIIFDDSDANIMGIYRILRTAKSGAAKPAVQHKSFSKPQWRLITVDVNSSGWPPMQSDSRVPKWVMKQLKVQDVDADKPYSIRVRYMKGKRYHYKGYKLYFGHGQYQTRVWRKPRMWYWKKLKAGKT